MKQLYDVLDPNAKWAGGERVSEDRTVLLTPEQAAYDLQCEAIALRQDKKKK